MNLGSVLRRKRKEKNLILKIVAKKAGISEGFLSQVENDVSSPSVDTLVHICNAIGINAGDIIREAEKQDRFVVIRSSEWEDTEIPKSGFVTQRFFSPDHRKIIDSSVMVLEPDSAIPGRKNLRQTQEILCVLKGTVDIECGSSSATLHKGDTVHYFWSAPEKQVIKNNSKGISIVLWVGTL